MSNPAKQIVLGAALLVGVTIVTNADPLPRTGDNRQPRVPLCRAAPANCRAMRPPPFSRPIQSRRARAQSCRASQSLRRPIPIPTRAASARRVSPNGRVRAEHYQASPDYMTIIAMHPYASGVGPKAGPNRAWRFEHYEVTAEYKADVSKHPFTSGFGVPPKGGLKSSGRFARCQTAKR
jgi:hypothetical protein